MQSLVTTDGPFYRALWPVADARLALLRNLLIAIVGSLLLWASAKTKVELLFVPMTMQTYVVLVIGAACGWRLGAATVALYLAQGAFGLPVFAGTPEKGLGLAYMAGPTGGYLLGFLLSAALIGWLAERGWDRSLWRMLVAMSLGHLLILALGAGYLATLIGVEAAWANGLEPFLLATLVKTLLAGATLPAAWWVLRRFT